MSQLKPHELIVLEKLVGGKIHEQILSEIKRNGSITEYDITGNGYFLTVSHPELPTERIVYSEPIVVGECDGIKTGFIVFIENQQLTFECHGWGEGEIPRNYRDREININVTEQGS